MTRVLTHEHITKNKNEKSIISNIYTLPYFRITVYGRDNEKSTELPIVLEDIEVLFESNNLNKRGTTGINGVVRFDDLIAGNYLITCTDPHNRFGVASKEVVIKKDVEFDISVTMYSPFISEATVEVLSSNDSKPVKEATVTVISVTNPQDYTNTLVTDDEGKILMTDLPVGLYDVKCTKRGYENKVERLDFTNKSPDKTITLQSHIISDYSVEVVNQTEEPIVDAVVSITNEYGEVYSETTNPNGFCTFNHIIAGIYDIVIKHADYITIDDTLEVKTETVPVTFGMVTKRTPIFRIQVVHDNGIRLQGAKIKLISIDEGIADIVGTTDNKGIITLTDVFVGQYNIIITHELYSTFEDMMRIYHNQTDIDTFTLEHLILTDVFVKAIDIVTKTPLENVEVVYDYTDDSTTPDVKVTTNSEGISGQANLKAGTYNITLNDLNYASFDGSEIPYHRSRTLPYIILNKDTQHDFLLEMDTNLIPFVDFTFESEVTGEKIQNHDLSISTADFTPKKYTTDENGKVRVSNLCKHNKEVTINVYGFTESWEGVVWKTFKATPTFSNNQFVIKIPARLIEEFTLIVQDFEMMYELPSVKVTTTSKYGSVTNLTDNNGKTILRNLFEEGDTAHIQVDSAYHNTYEFDLSVNFNIQTYITRAVHSIVNFSVNVHDDESLDNIKGAKVEITTPEGTTTAYTGDDGIATFNNHKCFDSFLTVSVNGYELINSNLNINKYSDGNIFEVPMTKLKADVSITFNSQYDTKPDVGTAVLSGDGGEYTASVIKGVCNFSQVKQGKYTLSATFIDVDSKNNKTYEPYSGQSGQFLVNNINVSSTISVTIKTFIGSVSASKILPQSRALKNYYFSYVGTSIQMLYISTTVPQRITLPVIKSSGLFEINGKTKYVSVTPTVGGTHPIIAQFTTA